MIGLLKAIGGLMAFYGLYSIIMGRIYAKSGISARYFYKDDEPISFWITCISYIFVGILILFTLEHKYG